MSSQNQSLGQFKAGGGRLTPEISIPVGQQMSVPTQTPFVAPRDVVPNNLGDMERFSPLNQLANALGTVGIGVRESMEAANLGMAKRKQVEANRQYDAGLVEAMGKVNKSTDVLADYTNKGLIPSNQNPAFQLGFQAQLATSLANQYRNEAVLARQNNPMASSQEILSPIKAKYMQAMQTLSPDIAAKFFVKPSLQVEDDDNKLYLKNKSDDFNAQNKNTVGDSIGAVIDSELTLNPNGIKDPTTTTANIVKGIEAHLSIASATRMPFKDLQQAVFDEVLSKAELAKTLPDKLAILDSLKDVKLPTGNRFISGDMALKYSEARDKITQDAETEEGRQIHQHVEQMQLNTQTVLAKISDDIKHNKLGSLSDYVSADPKSPVDNKQIAEYYNMADKSTPSANEKLSNGLLENASQDIITNHLTRTQIIKKYSMTDLANNQTNWKYLQDLGEKNENKIEQQKKPKNWDMGLVNRALQNINEAVTPAEAATLGYRGQGGTAQAGKYLNDELKEFFREKLVNDTAQWIDNQRASGHEPNNVEINNHINERWSGTYRRQKEELVQLIKQHPDRFHQILYGQDSNLPSVPKTSQSKNPYAFGYKKPPYSMQRHVDELPWATDPHQYQIAAKEFLNFNPNKRGPMYAFLVKSLTEHGQQDKVESFYNKLVKNPDQLLQILERNGYPTFRTRGRKQ